MPSFTSVNINNPKIEGKEKFIIILCCHVGRNNRDLIRNIPLDLDYLKELIMFDSAQE